MCGAKQVERNFFGDRAKARSVKAVVLEGESLVVLSTATNVLECEWVDGKIQQIVVIVADDSPSSAGSRGVGVPTRWSEERRRSVVATLVS